MTRLAINAVARDRTTPPDSNDDEMSSAVTRAIVTVAAGLSRAV
jgi:hypothetical protein